MDPLVEFLLRMGDNTCVLSHRLGEWCGKAPVLEEDIALANTALDLIGQTQMWLGLAADLEDAGRSADDLAMLRDVWDFRNALLVEQPNGDFGQTIMRQFLFDTWHLAMLDGLQRSGHEQIAAIAQKAGKEVSYHAERSAQTVIALGDGTPVSHARMQAALELLWPYMGEFFAPDAIDTEMSGRAIAPDLADLRKTVDPQLRAILSEATLSPPQGTFAHKGGRSGAQHSEHLGHMLTQMQWLQRAYPGATW